MFLGQFSKAISSIFSDHNAVRVEINYKKKKKKLTEAKKFAAKQQWIAVEIKGEIKTIP